MLQAVEITKNSKDLNTIKALYESAFPENERVDFRFILANSEPDDEAFEILAVYDGALFVGFVITLNAGDISHILYFAVNDKLRSKGYGSEILQSVHTSRPGQRFIADVEKPDDTSSNNEQRKKRIRFYDRNGYQKSEVEYRWNEEDYFILSYKGGVSKEEYAAFWERQSDLLQRAANSKRPLEETAVPCDREQES